MWASFMVYLHTTSLQIFFCFFLPMLPKKKNKEKEVLLPAGVLKSATYTVSTGMLEFSLVSKQNFIKLDQLKMN
jgi:hypothetical protein